MKLQGEFQLPVFPLIGEWTKRGLCREKVLAGEAHPDDWFPVRGAPIESIRRAVAICNACEVIDECRTWAVENNEYGIWGGLTSKPLARMRLVTDRKCVQCEQHYAIADDETATASFCSEECRRLRRNEQKRKNSLDRKARGLR